METTAIGVEAVAAEQMREKTPEPSEEESAGVVLLAEETIPDGGLQAWLQVAGAFFLIFNSWGVVNSFGAFQTFYETDYFRDISPSTISWIGSVQPFLLLGGGAIAGPLLDAGWCTSLLAVGSFCIVFGTMMTSVGTQYWHILLSQGFCVGLGAGCIVVPGLAVLPQWFLRRRALVTGIAVCGGSLGGVVYPLIFQNLLERIGFGWTLRVLGFLSLATCGFSVLVMRTRFAPRRVRSLVDPSAFREWPYLFYCTAMFCSNFGFFIPLFYLQTYALGHGLTDKNVALNLVAILNAASSVGRLAPAHLAVHIGPLHTIVLVVCMSAITCFCWISVDSAAGNVVFAVMYGFASGGIVSLPLVVLASITSDLKFLGARFGISGLFNAFAALCGAPLAGAILKNTGGYLGLQLFAGFIISMTAISFTAARVAKVGWKLRVKC